MVRRAEDGTRIVAAFRESGLTQKAFAESQGIKACTLGYWVKKLSPPAARESTGFVRVEAKPIRNGWVRLVVNSKVTLHFEVLPHPQYLAQLARALEC